MDTLRVGASVSNLDARAHVDYRHRFNGGQRLGLAASFGHAREVIVVGFAAENELVGSLGVESRFPILRRPRVQVDLGLDAAVRRVFGDDGPPQDASGSWALEVHASMIGTARAGRGAVRLGILVPFSMELAPEVVNDAQGALLHAGFTYPLSDRLWLDFDADAGGLFGSDGDAAKFLARGRFSLRIAFGDDAAIY
ncbi:MAG: hypothetical protein AAF411_08230 [Myxococcota bacterium]